MQTMLALLGQELKVSAKQLIDHVRFLDKVNATEQAEILKQCDALLNSMSGAITVSVQGSSQLPTYLNALKRKVTQWLGLEREEVASPEIQIMHQACQALYDYLDVLQAEGVYSELALFAVFSSIAHLGGETAHPMELWAQNVKQKTIQKLSENSVQHQLSMSAHERLTFLNENDRLTHQSQMDGTLLSILRSSDDRFSTVDAIRSGQILCDLRICAAQSLPLDVLGGSLLIGVFEAIASGDLELDIWLKKALLGSLDWLKGRADCPASALAFFAYTGWQKQQQRLQAHVPAAPISEATPTLTNLATCSEWVKTPGANYTVTSFGAAGDDRAAHLSQHLGAAKKALAIWSSEADPKASDRALLDASWAPFAAALIDFHSSAEPLAYEVTSLLVSPSLLQLRPVLIELATTLLTLEAMVEQRYSFDPLQLSHQFTELARRLKLTCDGLRPGALAPWMLSMQRSQAWVQTMAQLTQEMRFRVSELESAFSRENYALLADLVRHAGSAASTVNWTVFVQTAAIVHAEAQTLSTLSEAELVAAREQLVLNLAALGLFVDLPKKFGPSPVDGFSFDLVKLEISERDVVPAADELIIITDSSSIASVPQAQPEPMQDDELIALFQDEALDLLTQADVACTHFEASPSDLEVAVLLRRIFHTLKGSARMVGWANFGDQAWHTEQALNLMLSEKNAATPALCLSIRESIAILNEQLPVSQPLPLQVIEQPADWLDLSDTADTVNHVPETKTIGDITISLNLYNAYLNEADAWSRQLASALSEWAVDDTQPLAEQTLTWAHALAGSSATVGFLQLAALAKTTEQLLERITRDRFSHAALAQQLADGANEMRRILHQFAAGFLKDPDAQLLAHLQWLLKQPTDVALEQESRSSGVASPQQENDASLAAIFAEEAATLMPSLGLALRFWLQSPERVDQIEQRSEVLRLLHTLKGSSRLVGQLKLADQCHLLESAIESYGQMPDADQSVVLLAHYDQMELDDEVTQPDLVMQSGTASSSESAVFEVAEHLTDPILPLVSAASPKPVKLQPPPTLLSPSLATSGEVIRVKLGLIDRLINQSGEIMIARARMEAEILRSQHTLGDMGAQVTRLREQLRELELQTESQMQSRQAQVSDQAQVFDPLEFDRFTRTQELTRFMAEALSDISTLQRSLMRALNATEDDLAAQSRQARDLQRHLLQTRMVAFDSIAERLHRLVRLTSQELGKSVALSIHGGLQEMDRSVLERVVPAFEHLLRNAIVHGIEPSSERVAAGKPNAGQIQIHLVQNGNDVLVTVQDDGRGLDVAAVRAQAERLDPAATGLAESADPAHLIFMSGLSTADVVSELAGRGIGMDVVRSQVLALGGRIEVETQAGHGTTFRLVLPLTTAVTQIVLVRTGTLMTALPANLVQTVVRAKSEQMMAAQASGQWELATGSCAFYKLSQLLQHQEPGLAVVPPIATAHAPVQSVVLLSSSNQSIALWVDEVLGNQEVVVKNLGPQLAQMPGLAGMTVLPTGETILIYNPVALATVYGGRLKAAAQAAATQAASLDEADTLSHSVANTPVTPALAPLVLAVDDSITMRRVLQRLLQREGYRVVQAADGKQALEILRVEIPVLILSDVEMPRMDGFELLKQIRSSERMRDIPMVMITSRIADKHREHAKSLGANEYLGKPYPEEELIALLHRYAPL